MNHSLTATAVFALLGLTGSPAAQKKAVAKALTPESSLSARSISDLQLSPAARYGFGGCRYWLVQTPPLGWRLAVVIIATQVLGGLVNVLRGDVEKGAIGFTIAGGLLFYLLRSEVRAAFGSGNITIVR